MSKRFRYLTVLLAIASTAAFSAKPGDVYRGTLAPCDDILTFYGGVTPTDLQLRDKPIKPMRGVPKGAGRVRFGVIKLGNASDSGVTVMLVGSGGDSPKLYVDANRNGSFADEKPIECQGSEVYRAEFAAPAKYKDGQSIPTQVIVLFPSDPSQGAPIYGLNTCRMGNIQLADGKTAAIVLVDIKGNADFKDLSGIALLIDPTGKSDFANNPDLAEPYDPKEPFNIGGVTYELAYVDPTGTKPALRVSEQTVAERPMFLIGAPVPDFSATDVDGGKVSLSDYRGKIVLLDFWATWCKPCTMEMPNVKKAYDKFHKDGFDILGVSLDQTKTKMTDYIKKNGMPWRQICDDKIWSPQIARMYRIRAIPASFLLDKEGKIIARDLRGEALSEAVGKAVNGELKPLED